MSLNHLLSQAVENKWANPRFNSLNLDNGLNMLNSNISNVNEINGVPFSDVVNSAKSEIIWNPSQVLPKVENSYKNWSGVISVQSAIAELKGCVTINCDNTSPLNIDSSTDCQNRVVLKAANTRGAGAYAVVNINDGVILTNLYMIESSLQLKAAPTIIEPLAFSNNSVFGLRDGSNLSLGVGATKGFINLVGSTFTVSGFRFGILDNSAVPAVPIIRLDATSILYMLRTESSSCSNNSIVGPVGAQFIDLSDASSPAFTNAGYLGTYTPLVLDNSNQVSYDDSKVAPPLGSSNVQGALDALKSVVGGDVKFVGAAPVVSELAVFAAVDGKSIQASSVGGAVCNGDLDASGHDIKSATGTITTFNCSSCNSNAINTTNVFAVNGNFTVGLTSQDVTCVTISATNQVQAIRCLTGPIALANAAWTAVDYNISNSINGITYAAPQYTLPASGGVGVYYVGASMNFAPNAVGWRGIRVFNVTQNRYYCQQASLSLGAVDNSLLSTGIIVTLNDSDVLQIECYQNSGGALNIGAADPNRSFANIVRLY